MTRLPYRTVTVYAALGLLLGGVPAGLLWWLLGADIGCPPPPHLGLVLAVETVLLAAAGLAVARRERTIQRLHEAWWRSRPTARTNGDPDDRAA
ncbi:hypothetical protein [Streptomyces sp. CBMA152]|uniref:hypothetical protein n=1 Tax=Streptomyces sp. CBMA152 TaxID=1896312 RepID=UPI0016615436|nr:hypothetical protein [Streptomyces sp. CBMA152]MBD0743531.1 hypothetical protein [Streptomyces sp. CBMA152]